MGIRRSVLLFMLSFFMLTAGAQPKASAEQEALFNKLMGGIHTRHVNWVKNTAAEVNAKKLGEPEIRNLAARYGSSAKIASPEIEALVFLVMSLVAEDQKKDLKNMADKLKALREQKARQSELLAKIKQQRTMNPVQLDSFTLLRNRTAALRLGLNPDTVKYVRTAAGQGPATKQELDNQIDQLKSDLDSMSEMGETESLRLQMVMDRVNKFMTTISNILRKISATADAIVQNLK